MSEVKKEVYEVEKGRYGFRIIVGDRLRVIQEFKPNVEGWQPMTKNEADAEADKMVKLIPPPPPRPAVYELFEEVELSTGVKVTVTHAMLESPEELSDSERAEIEEKTKKKIRLRSKI